MDAETENSTKTSNSGPKRANSMRYNKTKLMYRLYIDDVFGRNLQYEDGSLLSLLAKFSEVYDLPAYETFRRNLKGLGAYAVYSVRIEDKDNKEAVPQLIRLVKLPFLVA